MLIDLDDPIWRRLYGPYGVQDVPGILARLQVAWDAELARDLFWEKLHHQEDLYPVTYAALPWLWKMTEGAGRLEVLGFLAWVLHCALRPEGPGTRRLRSERFLGLSLDPQTHQKDWLPEDQWLRHADMVRLTALQNWLEFHAELIAQTAAGAINGQDRFTDGYLLLGLTALRGGSNLALAIIRWVDGWTGDDLPDPEDDPVGLALHLAEHARPCPPLAAFLQQRGGGV